jgi:hypothetical protein
MRKTHFTGFSACRKLLLTDRVMTLAGSPTQKKTSIVQCRVVLTPPTRAIRAPQVRKMARRFHGRFFLSGPGWKVDRSRAVSRPCDTASMTPKACRSPASQTRPPTSRISRGAGKGAMGASRVASDRSSSLQHVLWKGKRKNQGRRCQGIAPWSSMTACGSVAPLAPPGAPGSLGWQGYTGRNAFQGSALRHLAGAGPSPRVQGWGRKSPP